MKSARRIQQEADELDERRREQITRQLQIINRLQNRMERALEALRANEFTKCDRILSGKDQLRSPDKIYDINNDDPGAG